MSSPPLPPVVPGLPGASAELSSWLSAVESTEWVSVDNNLPVSPAGGLDTGIQDVRPPDVSKSAPSQTAEKGDTEQPGEGINTPDPVGVAQPNDDKKKEEVGEVISGKSNDDIIDTRRIISNSLDAEDKDGISAKPINVNDLENLLLMRGNKENDKTASDSSQMKLLPDNQVDLLMKEKDGEIKRLTELSSKNAKLLEEYEDSLKRKSIEIQNLKAKLEEKEAVIKSFEQKKSILSANTNVLFIGFSEDVDKDIVDKLISYYEKTDNKELEVMYMTDYSINDIKKAVEELKGRQNTEVIVESSQANIFMHRVSEQLATLSDSQDTSYVCYDTPFSLAQFLTE